MHPPHQNQCSGSTLHLSPLRKTWMTACCGVEVSRTEPLPVRLNFLNLPLLINLSSKPPIIETVIRTASLCRVPIEYSFVEGSQLWGILLKLTRKVDFLPQNIVDGLVVIFWLKGRPSCNQFIEQYSCCPNIHVFAVSTASEHFGSAVEKSPSYCPHLKLNAPPSVPAAYAEVDDLDPLTLGVHQNVLHFDIPVRDCPTMQVGQRIEQLPHKSLKLLFATNLHPTETGRDDQLHHQPSSVPSSVFNCIDVHRLVLDDVCVGQWPHQQKLAFS